MASLIQFARAAVVIAFLSPLTGTATPIIDEEAAAAGGLWPVAGWTNSVGEFVVDTSNALNTNIAAFPWATYSTATSLFSYQSDRAAFVINGTNLSNGLGYVDTQMNVVVEGNGTITGNLLGGVLTMRAGAEGIPGLGADPGEILMVGYAIDSAALANVGVSLLFGLMFVNESLSAFGDYVTYFGTYGGVWGIPTPNQPWARDWGPLGGFTLDSLIPTHRVPEPASLALLVAALAALGWVRRSIQSDLKAAKV